MSVLRSLSFYKWWITPYYVPLHASSQLIRALAFSSASSLEIFSRFIILFVILSRISLCSSARPSRRPSARPSALSSLNLMANVIYSSLHSLWSIASLTALFKSLTKSLSTFRLLMYSSNAFTSGFTFAVSPSALTITFVALSSGRIYSKQSGTGASLRIMCSSYSFSSYAFIV